MKKFDLDLLKTSRNFEASFLINKLNAGVTAETDIIRSDAHLMPTSARFNFTTELFGQSINVLELGGRQEGVNRLIDKLLASYGFSDETQVSSRSHNEFFII